MSEKTAKKMLCVNHTSIRAYLHGGGGPQVGDVTRLGGITRLFI